MDNSSESRALRTAGVAAVVMLVAACGSSTGSDLGAGTSSRVGSATHSPSQPAPVTALGGFPAFPPGALPGLVASKLQAAIDAAVAGGSIRGATAGVIVAGAGSWSGAAGVDVEGRPLTASSALVTASVAKTVTAAQVLRLVEDGRLNLEDKASDRLPPELSGFDANGATIRDLLGMRSGLMDPPFYEDLVDQGQRTEDLVELAGRSAKPAGTTVDYANLNYLLLGEIIEHVTGQPLATVIRSDVLNAPDLDGFTYRVKDAMAADGWTVEANPATLARWGYELYGGFVLSDATLRDMADPGDQGYGLGAKDFSDVYDEPGAVGHGGAGDSYVTRLIAFPNAGVVIAVQTNADEIDDIHQLVTSLRAAVKP